MSKISLTPNASGTGNFTIASPNSNTDRTLTLPDATGTINTSGAVNEVPAGTASAPSIYPTGDTNTGIFFPAADTIGFTEGGAEAMRIDSSGRVQINLSADTNYQLSIAAKASQGGILANASTAGFASIQGIHSSNSATGYAAYFNNSGSGTGLYISNTAAWVSTSDERLKEDIKDLCTTERLLQLKPRDYLWKSQKTSDDPTKRNFGFIAQEIKEVFPELVGVSPDGMFSVEYTGLIAPLVKAIQEQQTIIETLKADIAELKAKVNV